MSVTLHMVSSLDGFIAKEDNDVSWMNVNWGAYSKGVKITTDILKTIDYYIMGSHTYEQALKLGGWPYGDTQTIVMTRRELASIQKSVEFYSGNIDVLTKKLKRKNVWLVGGPTVYQEFLRLNFVDKICLTIVPILLGNGIPFFRGNEHRLNLKDVTAFENGMVDLWYEVAPL